MMIPINAVFVIIRTHQKWIFHTFQFSIFGRCIMRYTKEEIKKIIQESNREYFAHGNYNQVSRTTDVIAINGYSCQWIIKHPYENYTFQIISTEPSLEIVKQLPTKYAYLYFDNKLYFAAQITGEFQLVIINSEFSEKLINNLNAAQPITNTGRKLTIAELKMLVSNSTHSLHVEDSNDPNNPFSLLNLPHRATEKCNLLNPNLPAYELGDFWIMPDVGVTRPTENQIIQKVIEIFIRTRNIIADAFVRGNFLLYKGEVICVDVHMALRKGSFCTDNLLDFISKSPGYSSYMKNQQCSIAKCVKALTYIQESLPDKDIKDEYLTPELINIYTMMLETSLTLTTDILDLMLQVIEKGRSTNKRSKHISTLHLM